MFQQIEEMPPEAFTIAFDWTWEDFAGYRDAIAKTLSVNVALVAQAPSDPYYAESLQQWEQGRFIHFHGLAQWVGWLWPFAAGATLFGRVVRSDAVTPA